MKRETIVITLAVLVVLVAGVAEVAGNLRESASVSTPASRSSSLPAPLRLAALDHAAGVPIGAETPYRLALRRLVDSCRENEDAIADMAISASREIRVNTGRIFTVLDVLEQAATIAPASGSRTPCSITFQLIRDRPLPR